MPNIYRKYRNLGRCMLLCAASCITVSAQQPHMITLDQAVQMAVDNSPSIKAMRTQIDQNKALEITADLRPNPVLSWDAQFFPFNPSMYSSDTLDNLQQFDVGLGYTFERGRKRQWRYQAARDQTKVTEAQVHDAERSLSFNVAQQFVNVVLAEDDLKFALEDLKSFRRTVDINDERYKAGGISKDDLLKIKIQLLQFESDVNAAKLAKVQALVSLRQLIGYSQIPRDYDVDGQLEYQPVKGNTEDLEALALKQRPDYHASELGITAAQSQVSLAKANGKQDLTVTADYSHASGYSGASVFFSIPLAIFDRNQGEIARTKYALNQAQFTAAAAQDTVLSDVEGAFETVKANQEIVELYLTGYLQQAQESRDINEFAYKQGAEALIDFLDAERSYRAIQLAYRQSVANYMLAVEQLREAVGTRKLP